MDAAFPPQVWLDAKGRGSPVSPLAHHGDSRAMAVATLAYRRVLAQRRATAIRAAAESLRALCAQFEDELADPRTVRRIEVAVACWFVDHGTVVLREGARAPALLWLRGWWGWDAAGMWGVHVQALESYAVEWGYAFTLTFGTSARLAEAVR